MARPARTTRWPVMLAALAAVLAGAACGEGDEQAACPTACEGSTPRCDPETRTCVACVAASDCGDGAACVAGSCQKLLCTPGAQACVGDELEVCNATGTILTTVSCDGAPCVLDHCRVCTPGSRGCSGLTVLVCREDGSAFEAESTCAQGDVCVNGQCLACEPGKTFCDGNTVRSCDPAGAGSTPAQDCETAQTGLVCAGGVCQDPCAFDVKFNTSLGCQYWAVDLDNAVEATSRGLLDAQNAPYAVIVSNPSAAYAANVKVESTDGSVSKQVTVAPGDLAVLDLPPLNVDGTVRGKLAWRIDADSPVTAYQFNPLSNVGVFSNDASLLLPTNSLGSDYRIIGRPQSVAGYRGFLTVVAAEKGATEVTVTVTAKTLGGEGIAALEPGGSLTAVLEQGEVLNIETDAPGADLTGSRVSSSRRVAVFSGAEAANAPNTEICKGGKCLYQGWGCTTNADCPVTCCADHLEQQLPPVATWGKRYFATRSEARGKAPDLWRIVAAANGTHVSTIPLQQPISELDAGEWVEIESTEDFLVDADKPILVGQFLSSQNAPEPNSDSCSYYPQTPKGPQSLCQKLYEAWHEELPCTGNSSCPNLPQAGDAQIGDPAFILAVPYEQFRKDYVFLVPDKYASNFVNIIAPAQSEVTLSGLRLGPSYFVPFGNGFFRVARVAALAGVHTVVSDQKVGVVVYGWDQYVSYGYPAGQNLQVLSF